MSESSKRKSYRRRSLQVERLDARLPLDGATWSAAAGLPWFEPGSLTYSFALEGTEVGGEHSNLFQTLGQSGTPLQWQNEFQTAFDEWLKPLGASIKQVSDTGAPFGSFGPTQGDSRFGDIRIGAIPLSGNVMAEAIPHSVMVQGTWAGDILLNSNLPWRDLHQVFAVALHEFGHVLGLRHSDDTHSPMYFNGVYSLLKPTDADIQQLKRLYTGVQLDSSDGSNEPIERDADPVWHEEPHFNFDPALAKPIQATLATSARYVASDSLTVEKQQQLFKLLPLGEIDHAAYLNVVITSREQNGLVPKVSIYDQSGDLVPMKTLHNGGGVLVIQAKDVEPNKFYYVAVSPAAAPLENQQGGFELLAEYGSASLDATLIRTIPLTATAPIAEQSFTVNTSRLVHVLINTKTSVSPSKASAIWGTLVDSQNEVVGKVAMRGGDSRSMPLVFLKAGTYRLILQIGNQDLSTPASMTAQVYFDEISIDVGPGVIDPTLKPMTDLAGTNTSTGKPVPPIVLVNGPVFPNPTTIPTVPTYPSIPPWSSPTWHYWPVVTPVGLQTNSITALDVSGDSLITPLDALLILNTLNQSQVSANQSNSYPGFLDTNGDGWLTPLDALLVFNYLNGRLAQGEGEGEGAMTMDFDSIAPRDLAQADGTVVDLQSHLRRRTRNRF